MVHLPVANPRLSDRKADIVFCIDATSSMQPCINSVYASIEAFLEGLQTSANVDFRLRLIGFRDLHDTRLKIPESGVIPFDIYEFTSSVTDFRKQLAGTQAICNQKHQGAESALDGLFIALQSDWRENSHRSVILITDDKTWPTLHPSTYRYTDNTVSRVVQEFQTLRHAMLYMIAPRDPSFQRIEQSMESAQRPVISLWLEGDDTSQRHSNLDQLPWDQLLRNIGQSISIQSIRIPE